MIKKESMIAKACLSGDMLFVAPQRYHGGWIAFIAPEDFGHEIQSWLSEGDDYYATIYSMLFGWGNGAVGHNTPLEAVAFLENLLEDNTKQGDIWEGWREIYLARMACMRRVLALEKDWRVLEKAWSAFTAHDRAFERFDYADDQVVEKMVETINAIAKRE